MDKKNISTDVSTDTQPTPISAPKQLTFEDVEVYKPIKDNINYHGEWIFKLG
jgi:hypothetical protein